jgi:hypothetical protein
MKAMLDRCIVCGNEARKPGAGMCLHCEIQALIDLSFDPMRVAIRGQIPVIGKRLQPASHPRSGEAKKA